MNSSLRIKAQQLYQDSILDFSDIEYFEDFLENTNLSQDKMYLISWCGSETCAESIEQKTNFTILGYDYQLKHIKKKCMICASLGIISVLAKRY